MLALDFVAEVGALATLFGLTVGVLVLSAIMLFLTVGATLEMMGW